MVSGDSWWNLFFFLVCYVFIVMYLRSNYTFKVRNFLNFLVFIILFNIILFYLK